MQFLVVCVAVLGSGGVFVDADGNIGCSLLLALLVWAVSLERSVAGPPDSLFAALRQATSTWPCGEPSHSSEAGSTCPNTRCKHHIFWQMLLGCIEDLLVLEKSTAIVVVLLLPTKSISIVYIFRSCNQLGLTVAVGWCPQRLAIGGSWTQCHPHSCSLCKND